MLGQGPVEVGGFLGGCEGLSLLAVAVQIDGEVVEGGGEVGGVGGWVVLGQISADRDCFLGGLQGLIASP